MKTISRDNAEKNLLAKIRYIAQVLDEKSDDAADYTAQASYAYVIREWNAEHQKPHKQTAEYEGILPLPVHDNWWFGSSLDNANARRFQGGFTWNTFTSIKPLTEYMDMGLGSFGSDKWTIIGAETGNRKGKVIPQREWVENILEAASITGVKVFMKESLRGLMGDDFRQEFPWEAESDFDPET